MSTAPPPRNGTGHGSGQYARPEDVKVYTERMEGYLRTRNATWLDRHTDRATGEIRAGVKDLCNVWRADNHVVKVAIAAGRLDPASMPDPRGQKHRQIGMYSAIVYCGSPEGRRFVAFELKQYLDRLEAEQLGSLEREEE